MAHRELRVEVRFKVAPGGREAEPSQDAWVSVLKEHECHNDGAVWLVR